MAVPGVLGCHQIRTRGSADHVFLDLHVWLPADMPLTEAHAHVARREGSADGAISADRRCGHPHRAAAAARSRFQVSACQSSAFRRDGPGTIRGVRGEKDRRRAVGGCRNPGRPRWMATQRIKRRSATSGRARSSAAHSTCRRRRRRICHRPVWCSSNRSDGNTGAADPSTLGGGRDRQALIYEGLSRVAADAVLSGAETLRGGDMVLSVWHPELVALRRSLGLPRHPVQVVATLRGLPSAQA